MSLPAAGFVVLFSFTVFGFSVFCFVCLFVCLFVDFLMLRSLEVILVSLKKVFLVFAKAFYLCRPYYCWLFFKVYLFKAIFFQMWDDLTLFFQW